MHRNSVWFALTGEAQQKQNIRCTNSAMKLVTRHRPVRLIGKIKMDVSNAGKASSTRALPSLGMTIGLSTDSIHVQTAFLARASVEPALDSNIRQQHKTDDPNEHQIGRSATSIFGAQKWRLSMKFKLTHYPRKGLLEVYFLGFLFESCRPDLKSFNHFPRQHSFPTGPTVRC